MDTRKYHVTSSTDWIPLIHGMLLYRGCKRQGRGVGIFALNQYMLTIDLH